MTIQEKTPRQILLEDLSHHQLLMKLATISAFGFSAWYWTSLPTHGFTRFDIPAIFAAVLGLFFVATYEFTKLMAAKKGHSNKFFMTFVAFSIITGVGTHMHSEQGATEEKMANSSLFNTSLENIKQADAQAREFAYAAAFDVAALEKERDAKVNALLQSPAMKADGQPSGSTVAAVISKGWKSYSHYKTQVEELKASYNEKINAKNKYDAATKSRSSGESNAKNTDGTETAEASWIIQIIGQILGLFGVTEKINVWSGFVIYLLATIVLEMTIRFNGKEILSIREQLDATSNHSIKPSPVAEQQYDESIGLPVDYAVKAEREAEHAAKQQAEKQQEQAPALPFMSHNEIGRHCYKVITSMVNSGALPLTQNHIKSAAKVELSRLSKTHQLEYSDYEKYGAWIYNELKKERDEMQALAQQAKQSAPALHTSAPVMSAVVTDAPPAPQPDPTPVTRPIGFVQTDNKQAPVAQLPADQHKDGTGIHSPALGKAEAIYPLPLPEPTRVDNRVEAVQPPPSDPVANHVDMVQHGHDNHVDMVQHGQTNMVPNTVQHGEQKPNNDQSDMENRALEIIWKGIDQGIVQRISVTDNGQCAVALKGHSIGKSNPQRRTILAFVFDALAREQVLTKNPEYTDSSCGKPEWLINPSRRIKYAA
ncbi:hypothetical protein [Thiothrix winogradskyi]|uniref:Uncharacterized protein n=1 Tax=Thiothrix winogradskyi TaxID=96472 RepID=A0ABY3T4Q3_9GAMM|nr:hypothetical protein [Thiothrix winogradskyi]UJS26247.1 hypothetical protein L2Y54_09470 [Thiothrix winogradskyi]